MYRIYFKQAWQLIRQNAFMSSISIIGTAVAITMIMVILITDNIQNISIPPETNRDRTYYIRREKRSNTQTNNHTHDPLKYNTMKHYLSGLEIPEYVCVMGYPWPNSFSEIKGPALSEPVAGVLRKTDCNYWKLFTFSFIEGTPFNQSSFESGVKEAVISQTMARTLFKGEKVLGETILVEETEYRVCGVVKDVSPVFRQAYGQVWIPYTSIENHQELSFLVMLVARNKKDYPAIKQEIKNIEKKYSIENPPYELKLKGPENHRTHSLGNNEIDNDEVLKSAHQSERKRIFILFILLLIPAVNLSSLSLSQMKKRTEEIGIRKAFGAKRYRILIQVLCENMITSLMGAIIGLFLSYIVIFQLKDWLLEISKNEILPLNVFVSFPVLISITIICLIINLLSAAIPAYRAANMNIIQSINKTVK